MSKTFILRKTFAALFIVLLSAAVLPCCGQGSEDGKQSGESVIARITGGKAQKQWVQKLADNVKAFRSAKVEKAVSYISERFPNGTVAFMIEEAFYNDPDSENYLLLQEMQKRLNEKGISCDDVLIVGKKGIDSKTGEDKIEDPLDASIMKKQLQMLVDKVDIVVNFAGLPKSVADLRKITFLVRKNTGTGKNNMLLMCDSGLAYVDPNMIRNGRVCAIIDYISPKGLAAQFDIAKDTAPNDPADAFDYLYYFIKADTLDSFIADGNKDFFLQK